MKGIQEREQKALERIRKDIKKDKPIVSQTVKKVRQVTASKNKKSVKSDKIVK